MQKTFWEKLKQHPLAAIGLYMAFYFLVFFTLEAVPRSSFHIIHCTLDDHIPFLPVAVVPYVVWFGWVPFWVLRFLLRSKEEFWRMFSTIVAGTAVALAIYTVYPTAVALRQPLTVEGPFTALLWVIYGFDTPTNVCPSLHVFVSVELWLSLHDSEWVSRTAQKWNLALCAAICCSTVLIDQHSCIDVLCGLILAIAMHSLFNRRTLLRFSLERQHRNRLTARDLR